MCHQPLMGGKMKFMVVLTYTLVLSPFFIPALGVL